MVRKFFWFRLETAAMVTGWVGTAGFFVSIIFFGFCLAYVDTIKKVIEDLKPGDKDDEELRMLLVTIFILHLALNAMNLAASFALIVGTLREKHLWLLPWLTNSAIGLVINLTSYLALVVQTIQISSSYGSLSLIFGAIGLVLYTYIWLAIYSHYKILQGTQDEQKSLLFRHARTSYTKA